MRTTYDRYKLAVQRCEFTAPELGGLDVNISEAIRRLDIGDKLFYTEFTGKLSNVEVHCDLEDRGLLDYPESLSYLFEKCKDLKYRNEILRFYVNIELHYLLPYKQKFTKEEIWYRAWTEGANFANWLDDYYSYAYRNSFGVKFSAPPEFESVCISNYSEIFPPCALPRIEEEIFDIREWSLKAPFYNERIRQEVLYEIESILRNIDKLYIPDFREVVENIKDTVTYYDGVKCKPHELNLRQHSEISTRYVGYETKILVYPSGMRDTVILEKSSSNMIRYVEKLFLSIIHHCEESIYGLHGDRLRETLDLFDSINGLGYHINRDIRKCGLTVPIQLYIDDIQELLEKYFPNGPWFCLNIYKDIKIQLTSGTWVSPKRGVGLGMANNLTTLLCIAMHRLAKRYFNLNHHCSFEARIGNDDSDVFIYGTYEEAEEYMFIERSIIEDAGFTYNRKKSYISERYHFFEEYGTEGFRYKESLAIAMLTKSLLEKNFRIAKYMSVEAQKLAPTLNIYKIIEGIALKRGNEFYDGEINAPFWQGGWVFKRLSPLYLGLDSLAEAYTGPDERVYRASCIVSDYESLTRTLSKHIIRHSWDNSNVIYRRNHYIGDSVKGAVGYFNYSLEENYNFICKKWKMRNQPFYALKQLNRLYRKTYPYSKANFLKLLLHSGKYRIDMPLSSIYVNEVKPRTYLVPCDLPYRANDISFFSMELANLVQSLPKEMSRLELDGGTGWFSYQTVITNVDPSGRRNAFNDPCYILAGEEEVEEFDVLACLDRVEGFLQDRDMLLRRTYVDCRSYDLKKTRRFEYVIHDGQKLGHEWVIFRPPLVRHPIEGLGESSEEYTEDTSCSSEYSESSDDLRELYRYIGRDYSSSSNTTTEVVESSELAESDLSRVSSAKASLSFFLEYSDLEYSSNETCVSTCTIERNSSPSSPIESEEPMRVSNEISSETDPSLCSILLSPSPLSEYGFGVEEVSILSDVSDTMELYTGFHPNHPGHPRYFEQFLNMTEEEMLEADRQLMLRCEREAGTSMDALRAAFIAHERAFPCRYITEDDLQLFLTLDEEIERYRDTAELKNYCNNIVLERDRRLYRRLDLDGATCEIETLNLAFEKCKNLRLIEVSEEVSSMDLDLDILNGENSDESSESTSSSSEGDEDFVPRALHPILPLGVSCD